jgi:endonuclease/exonuclease/phosphatase family metal-dependent hydrolase
MRRALVASVALAFLASLSACGSPGGSTATSTAAVAQGAATAQGTVAVQSQRHVRVLTRNLYLGADVDPLIATVANPGSTQAQLLVAATTFWETVKASDPPTRMAEIAEQIAAEAPDLVGLQEASLWRTAPFGSAAPAEDVAYDFIGLLVAALHARGLDYDVAAAVTNFDAELPVLLDPTKPVDPANPAANLLEVRMTDRDAILARSGTALHVLEASAGNYTARVQLSGLAVPRGWTSVSVKNEGAWFRFVNTHLEVTDESGLFTAVQEAQAKELVALLADEEAPVVVAGDLNSNASGTPSSASYQTMRDAGFGDLWAAVHPADPGLSCCQSELLRDVVPFTQRLDLLLLRGPWAPLDATLLATEPFRAPDGVHVAWGSDHAGVAGSVRPLFAGKR